MPIGGQELDQAALFSVCSPQRLHAHTENGTVNMDYAVNLDIRSAAISRVGYLGLGFAHLLPDMSRSGWVFVPS